MYTKDKKYANVYTLYTVFGKLSLSLQNKIYSFYPLNFAKRKIVPKNYEQHLDIRLRGSEHCKDTIFAEMEIANAMPIVDEIISNDDKVKIFRTLLT